MHLCRIANFEKDTMFSNILIHENVIISVGYGTVCDETIMNKTDAMD